eukprot:15394322-Alexandrium_andersonii.AAC.1
MKQRAGVQSGQLAHAESKRACLMQGYHNNTHTDWLAASLAHPHIHRPMHAHVSVCMCSPGFRPA